jgi:hypothetical protein
MPKYVIKLEGTSPGEFEYEEFFVENDPDPPGKWKCWYRNRYHDGEIDYFIYLPKTDGVNRDLYWRREQVLQRDLTCVSPGMTCELLSMEKIEEEPRQPSLIRLAIQVERSKAMLMGRDPRKFLDVYEG